MSEIGRRIRSACSYASLASTDELAQRTGIEVATLRQIETGVIGLDDIDLHAVIRAISDATGVPETWFTADWDQLHPGWIAPVDRIDRLEAAVRELIAGGQQLLERIDQLARQADEQLRVGSERLDQFAAVIQAAQETQPPNGE